jgi:integrase
VGDLEWTDLNLYLVATEKGRKERRLALLEAATPVLQWLDLAGTRDEPDAPLFAAVERDCRTVTRRHLSRRTVLNIVKKYARRAGLEADRHNRRGIGVHSLRKTAGMSALMHGAKVEQVQAWLGHADIRTTQEYIVYKDKDAEEAARHCQIR